MYGNCASILVPKTHIDDEYANASERDPKILITTSRNPSAPLTQFVKVGSQFIYDGYTLLFTALAFCKQLSFGH
jgi:hypothetical protein